MLLLGVQKPTGSWGTLEGSLDNPSIKKAFSAAKMNVRDKDGQNQLEAVKRTGEEKNVYGLFVGFDLIEDKVTTIHLKTKKQYEDFKADLDARMPMLNLDIFLSEFRLFPVNKARRVLKKEK